MALDWIPRDNTLKDHQIFTDDHFGTEPPCTMFEKKPLVNPNTGEKIEGLYTAWVTLNNPTQLGSYTTEMVKGVIAGMHKASMDRTIVATIFTGTGDRGFCTGGNTKEYAEYYTKRPKEYADYIDLFAGHIPAASRRDKLSLQCRPFQLPLKLEQNFLITEAPLHLKAYLVSFDLQVHYRGFSVPALIRAG